jgi:hypothetical protein
VVFNFNEPQAALDKAILKAIISVKKRDLGKVLRQAMVWDRVDIARSALMSNTSDVSCI